MKKFIALFISTSILLTACSTATTEVYENEIVVGVVLKTSEHEYFKEIEEGIMEAAQIAGVNAIIISPHFEEDTTEQNLIIFDLIEKGVDALLIAPTDSTQSDIYTDLALDKGIPVIAVDTKTNDTSIPFVGSNNYNIGLMAGEYVADNFKTPINIGIISNSTSKAPHSERISGFVNYINYNTEHTIVSINETDANIESSVETATRAIKNEPLDLVYCTSSIAALGAVEVYHNKYLSSNTKIISIDSEIEILSNIKQGKISATVSQNAKQIGYDALNLALDKIYGTSEVFTIFIESEVIHDNNVDQYIYNLN